MEAFYGKKKGKEIFYCIIPDLKLKDLNTKCMFISS